MIHYLTNYALKDLRISAAASTQRRLSFIGTDNRIRVYNYDYCEILNPPDNNTTLLASKDKITGQFPKAEYLHNTAGKTQDLKIWPNPVSTRVTFDSKPFIDQTVLITIFDSNGRRIYQASQPVKTASHTIQLGHPAGGSYYLQVSTKTNSGVGKFIVEK